MSIDHTTVLSAALIEASRRGWRLSPNQQGLGFQGTILREYDAAGSTGPRHIVKLADAFPIRFGLFDSAGGDAVGWQSIEITPRMVGGVVAVYTEIFTRAPRIEAMSEERRQHAAELANAGGFGYVATRSGGGVQMRRIIPTSI